MNTEPSEISNGEDVIDSRDVIARIAWLESNRDDFQSDNGLEDYEDFEACEEGSLWEDWDTEYGMELENLLGLQSDMESYGDWSDGMTLIRDTYFSEYCKEYLEEIGYINRDGTNFLMNHIDWDGVAEEMQIDYTCGEFGGVTYWGR